MDNSKSHIALSTLYDVLSGASAMDVTTEFHLYECITCRAEMRWLESLWSFGRRERQSEPPEWAVSNAVHVFQLKRPNLVKFATQIVASLIYDSFSEPLPAGVRHQRDLPTRQALYQAEGLQLDLKIQLSDEKGMIIGQVLAEDRTTDVPTGLRVELSQKGDGVRSSETNEWGEFMFEGLPQGNYEIEISFPDRLVKLPPLTVTKG